MKRSSWRIGAAVLLAVALGGCRFDGIQSVTLPGTVGTGDDAYEVTVELPNVGTLVTNGQVKVDDVAVGTVRSIKVDDWHAVATLTIEKDVVLPANAVAAVGVNSLLGSAYVELAPPTTEPAQGRLGDGDLISLEHGSAYPSTEEVLSSASVVLNGGGLEQLKTITTELNRALGGSSQAVKSLLPRLTSFVSELDAQKADIFSTIEDLDRLAARFKAKRHVLNNAVDQLAPAFTALNAQRKDLTKALKSLDVLGQISTRVIASSQEDLVANLRDLRPTLQALSDAGESIVGGVGFALTFPFPPATTSRACRGDYCNLFLTLNLTVESLLNVLLPGGAKAVAESKQANGGLVATGDPAIDGLLNNLLGQQSEAGTAPPTGNLLQNLLKGALS